LFIVLVMVLWDVDGLVIFVRRSAQEGECTLQLFAPGWWGWLIQSVHQTFDLGWNSNGCAILIRVVLMTCHESQFSHEHALWLLPSDCKTINVGWWWVAWTTLNLMFRKCLFAGIITIKFHPPRLLQSWRWYLLVALFGKNVGGPNHFLGIAKNLQRIIEIVQSYYWFLSTRLLSNLCGFKILPS
jgi:hypothetical protein